MPCMYKCITISAELRIVSDQIEKETANNLEGKDCTFVLIDVIWHNMAAKGMSTAIDAKCLNCFKMPVMDISRHVVLTRLLCGLAKRALQ